MFLAFADPLDAGATRFFSLFCYAIGFLILPKKQDTIVGQLTTGLVPEEKTVVVKPKRISKKEVISDRVMLSDPRPSYINTAPTVVQEKTNSGLTSVFKAPKDITSSVLKRGVVSYQKEKVSATITKELKRRFIAFDVETTGLKPYSDRIIELGAVLYENGLEVSTFSSLINPQIHIPKSASAVNHITDSMVKNAPLAEVVFPDLVSFLGDALDGKTLLCAHNASFDMGFLSEALMDLGINGRIRCVDTLVFARRTIKGLPNYKQDTIASHLGIVNDEAHRALSDASTCGKMLLSLLALQQEAVERESTVRMNTEEKNTPLQNELEVCAVIQDCLERNNCDTRYLRFRKNSTGYVASKCLYTFNRFKFAKRGKYIIVPQEASALTDLPISPCTVSEGGTQYVRVFFSNPTDLYPLEKAFVEEFNKAYKDMLDYIELDDNVAKEAIEYIDNMFGLSQKDVQGLLKQVSLKQYESLSYVSKPIIKREDIKIQPIHSRCQLADIRNKTNPDKAFDEGYPYWEKGESLRKGGEYEAAIKCFDKARYYGYDAPVLYTSYAMAYHRMKDYDNEIAILDEFLERNEYVRVGSFEARRNKAIELLLKQQENEKRNAEKQPKEQKSEKQRKSSSANRGRAILQLDDDGAIIKEYNSVNNASMAVGVSQKSIRDAAKGVQKHAGGFVWKYKDEY